MGLEYLIPVQSRWGLRDVVGVDVRVVMMLLLFDYRSNARLWTLLAAMQISCPREPVSDPAISWYPGLSATAGNRHRRIRRCARRRDCTLVSRHRNGFCEPDMLCKLARRGVELGVRKRP